MSRSRSYRRHQADRVSQKRIRIWGRMIAAWKTSPKILGQMRKSNFSCACGHCNPHKVGYDKSLPISDRRKLGKVKRVGKC